MRAYAVARKAIRDIDNVTCYDYIVSDIIKFFTYVVLYIAYVITFIVIFTVVRIIGHIMYEIDNIAKLIANNITSLAENGIVKVDLGTNTNDILNQWHGFMFFCACVLVFIVLYRIHYYFNGRCIKQEYNMGLNFNFRNNGYQTVDNSVDSVV